MRGQLEPWEASQAIWVRQALRLDTPIEGTAAPPPAPPRDPEMVRPGSLREDGTQTGYPYGVQVPPEVERRPDPLALELAGRWVEQEAQRCGGVLTLDQAALVAGTTPAELRAELAMAGWVRCTADPCAWCGTKTFSVAGVAWRSCPQACAVVKGHARELHRALFLQN